DRNARLPPEAQRRARRIGAHPGEGAAEGCAPPARAHRSLCVLRRRRAQDTLPRRRPPRPGAGAAKRFRDHRLRGRAGAHPRGTARQALAAARRGRHAALFRLRAVDRVARRGDYARWSALRRAVKAGVDLDRVAPLGAAWEQQAREAFVAAYDAAIQGAGVYASLDKARGLLDLFVLEKALYELRYELTNRPDWAAIPLHGILALAR